MKVLILVTSAGIEPWLSIERKGQEPTFGAMRRGNVEIIWMEADSSLDKNWVLRMLDRYAESCFNNFRVEYNRLSARGLWHAISSIVFNGAARAVLGWRRPAESKVEASQRFRFAHPSLYSLQTLRMASYFRHALACFQFDYLLRVSSTCYVDIDQLLSRLEGSPRTRLYAGDLYTKRTVAFVGGAAVLFSRDVVEALVANEKSLRLDVHEDVAYGELIDRMGFASPTQTPRVDVKGKSMSAVVDAWASPTRPFVFRCKYSETWTDDPEPVVSLMHDVHNAIEREKSRLESNTE